METYGNEYGESKLVVRIMPIMPSRSCRIWHVETTSISQLCLPALVGYAMSSNQRNISVLMFFKTLLISMLFILISCSFCPFFFSFFHSHFLLVPLPRYIACCSPARLKKMEQIGFRKWKTCFPWNGEYRTKSPPLVVKISSLTQISSHFLFFLESLKYHH